MGLIEKFIENNFFNKGIENFGLKIFFLIRISFIKKIFYIIVIITPRFLVEICDFFLDILTGGVYLKDG